jgi:hypothetical protein
MMKEYTFRYVQPGVDRYDRSQVAQLLDYEDTFFWDRAKNEANFIDYCKSSGFRPDKTLTQGKIHRLGFEDRAYGENILWFTLIGDDDGPLMGAIGAVTEGTTLTYVWTRYGSARLVGRPARARFLREFKMMLSVI